MANTRRFQPFGSHFFKPILPGSLLQLSIPKRFLKYLDGENGEGEAILKSSRSNEKAWRVKLNAFRFEEGWNDFVNDHDLHVGDFLVFRHEGGMVFNVMVFDASACEKEYPPLDSKTNKREKERGEERVGKKQAIKNLDGTTTTPEVMRYKGSSSSTPLHDSQFTVTLKYYNLRDSIIPVPKILLTSNGLGGKGFIISLKDPKGRSWEVNLTTKKSDNRTYIKSGWRDFAYGNKLKIGDVCTFKLISTGLKPVIEVTISRSASA